LHDFLAQFLSGDEIRLVEHGDAASEKAPMVVHRLEFPVSDRKHIGDPRVNPRDRIDSRFSFHNRRMEPGFGRGGMVAFHHFCVEIHGEKFVLRDQGEAHPRGHQEKIRIGDARANMTESLDQVLMREDATRADHVFFELTVRFHRTPLNFV
jgi:hypothetical protein